MIRFIIRDYKFNEKDLETSKRQRAELATMEKEQWAQLIRLVKANFGELFSCWIHLKAIRTFVESVLRYGLPPDFMSAVIEPVPKQEKKVRDQLALMFDPKASLKEKPMEEEFEEMSLIAGVEKEYYAYVTFPITFSME